MTQFPNVFSNLQTCHKSYRTKNALFGNGTTYMMTHFSGLK